MTHSLNIGKDSGNNLWLCLVENETRDIEPLALFATPAHSELFIEYMESQGYIPLRLPTDEDYEQLLGGDS